MSLPSYAVYFRGHPCCPCQAKWLPVFEAECQRRGLISGELPISQLIGLAATSGNTHSAGGAADFYPVSTIKQVDGIGGFVWVARQMGADPTWRRPYNWDAAHGVEHVHSVLRDCPHNGPARYQVVAVDQGFNGLGHLGQSAADTGPRPLSGRTWRQGIEWAKQQEDDMPAPKDWDKDDWAAFRENVGAGVLDAALNAKSDGEAAFKTETVRSALKRLVRPLLDKKP